MVKLPFSVQNQQVYMDILINLRTFYENYIYDHSFTVSVLADDTYGTLIFEDKFERNESQETKDEPGNGWQTNSKSRAKTINRLI